MKRVNRLWTVLGLVALLGLSAGSALAQQEGERRRERGGDRGSFDPAEFQKRMMERVREQLEVTSDDEWKVIEPRVAKVMEARRDVSMGGGFGRGGRGGPPGGGDQGGSGRSPFGGEPSPEADALRKAVEAKAPAEEIKAKLAKFREAKKAKEAVLAKAQDELKKVLSLRQEATAVMSGLL
jgi:hypothetical protein